MNSGFLIAAWLLANLLAVGAYDVFAFFFARQEDTVSYWIQIWLEQFPILAVSLGIVIGHLAWPLHRFREGPK